MKENKEAKISYWAAHLTTIVSVTLVLLLIGIIALIWISAGKETVRLKEQLEISVIMADSVSDKGAADVAEFIKQQPYARDVKVISKEEALRLWTAETGENLKELYGVNPLSPEVCFTLNAAWSDPAKVEKIATALEKSPLVESVATPEAGMVESMNRNIAGLTLILGIIAGVMIFISFVLINNTVHLTIYSRRFTIHTMQLVGATNGFIRRPIIMNNILCGLIAGLVASAFIAIALLCAPQAGINDPAAYFGWDAFAFVAGMITLAGMALCGLSALVASSRYLRKDYDELFK